MSSRSRSGERTAQRRGPRHLGLWAAVAVVDRGLTGPEEVPDWRRLARFGVLAAGFGAVLVGIAMQARGTKHPHRPARQFVH